MLPQSGQFTRSHRDLLWLKRWIAILTVLNLALVFFDLTYLRIRPLYLQLVPGLVQIYDPVKGIHPHPDTQRYLEQVFVLEAQLAQTAIESPEVAEKLAELRLHSQALVQNNPFAEDGNAILETIRQTLQSRTGAESSFVAFDRFWSQQYLSEAGWQTEIEFWQKQIHPLMNANYYRRVNRFGHPVDYFWLIDLLFIFVFAIDLTIRGQAIRRRYPELSWLESVLRRWYDLFLLLPIWRWLRVIPAIIRLHQVGLLNLEPLQAEARRDFAIGFAKDLTEVVGIQAIDQLQAAIRRGEVMQWLLYPELRSEYIQVNAQNELEAIATHVANIVVHQVLPQIQPDLETLVYYNLCHIFEQLPGYRQLKHIPGVNSLPNQMTERLTKNLSELAYQSLIQIWEDPEIAGIATQLAQNFRNVLAIELRKEQNTQEIEALLIDMLEEVKINYVKGIATSGIEKIVDEAKQLQYKVKP